MFNAKTGPLAAIAATLTLSCAPARVPVMMFDEARDFVERGEEGQIFIHEGNLSLGDNTLEVIEPCTDIVPMVNGCEGHPTLYNEILIFENLDRSGSPIRLLYEGEIAEPMLRSNEVVSIQGDVSQLDGDARSLLTDLEIYELQVGSR